MLEIYLWLILGVAAVMLMFGFAMRLAVRRITVFVESRQRAAEIITIEQRAPPEWLAVHAARLRKLQEGSAPPERVEAAGRKAKARLLREVDHLLRYYENSGAFDSEQTRQELLRELRAQRDAWADAQWQEVVEYDHE